MVWNSHIQGHFFAYFLLGPKWNYLDGWKSLRYESSTNLTSIWLEISFSYQMWRKKTPKIICLQSHFWTSNGQAFQRWKGKVQHYILLWGMPTWPSRICSNWLIQYEMKLRLDGLYPFFPLLSYHFQMKNSFILKSLGSWHFFSFILKMKIVCLLEGSCRARMIIMYRIPWPRCWRQ
jgi:hypothetical protein